MFSPLLYYIIAGVDTIGEFVADLFGITRSRYQDVIDSKASSEFWAAEEARAEEQVELRLRRLG